MPDDRDILSRHLFRRTARRREQREQRDRPTVRIEIEPATRGPFRWYVVRYR